MADDVFSKPFVPSPGWRNGRKPFVPSPGWRNGRKSYVPSGDWRDQTFRAADDVDAAARDARIAEILATNPLFKRP